MMVMQIIPEISLIRLQELAKLDHLTLDDLPEKDARLKRKFDLSTAAALHAQSDFQVTLIVRTGGKLHSINTSILHVDDQTVTLEPGISIPLKMVAVVDFF